MYRLLVTLALVPIFALAAPGENTRRLMNEPVSLFDLGIYKMGQTLEAEDDHFESLFSTAAAQDPEAFVGTVTYAFNDDKINIDFLAIMGESDSGLEFDDERLEQGCKEVLESAVRHFPLYVLASQFSHEGYQVGDPEEDWPQELAERVSLSCSAVATNAITQVTVTRSLLTDETFVSKSETESDDSE